LRRFDARARWNVRAELPLIRARFDDVEDVMSRSRTKNFSLKALAVFASLLMAAPAITIPTAAQARAYYGGPGWGGRGGRGFVARPAFRPAFGGYRPAFGGYRQAYRPWRGAYAPVYRGGYYPYARPIYRRAYYSRPAYWGGYGYGSGYPYYGGYYRSYDDGGGALAAGLIGGLALGAIANAAARPATYRQASYGNCFYERRRVVLRNGHAVVRRVRSCY
jgi:hypothetical protein